MFPITSVIRNVTVRLRSSLGTTEIPLGLHVVIVNLAIPLNRLGYRSFWRRLFTREPGELCPELRGKKMNIKRRTCTRRRNTRVTDATTP